MIKFLILVALIGICVIAGGYLLSIYIKPIPKSMAEMETRVCLMDFVLEKDELKRDGTTDLFTISENKTEQLVGNGQNISAADTERISIHTAAKNGFEKDVERLIQEQSDVDAKDNNGDTPLHLAAIWGHDKVVQLLIDHGSNVSATDIDGNTPLHLAADWGHDKVVQLLLEHRSNASATNTEGFTPLHYAARLSHDVVVQQLIEHNSNVFATNNDGDTALHRAAFWGKDQFVKQLIKRGSNVSATNNKGNTPMLLAATWGHEIVVQLLIEHGSNVSAVNNDGNTALHLSAAKGHEIVVHLLIEHGSNVSAVNNDGNTALHLSASKGHGKVVELLRKRGVSLRTTNENEEEPLALDHTNVANVSTINNDGNSTLHLAAFYGYDILVQLLMEHGSNVSATNNNGNTPMHLAASEGHCKIVELFWKKGVNLHIKNGGGEEPLAMAERLNHTNVVNLLRKAVAREEKIQNLTKACEQYSMEALDFYVNNGEKSELGEFPWMAALIYLESDEIKNKFKCGGTIISEQYILTAAHCVEEHDRPFAVRLGGVKLDESGADNYKIKEFILHPEYSKPFGKNDIALIKVDREILFYKFLRPACVETVLSDELPNVRLNVTGWGSTDAERTNTPMQLHKAKVTTVPLAECNATYLEYDSQAINTAYRNGIDESQYCAHDPNGRRGPCHGDSGGPLQIFRNPRTAHVIGIVSAGIACGALPTIHTRVAYYAEWIASSVCFGCIETLN